MERFTLIHPPPVGGKPGEAGKGDEKKPARPSYEDARPRPLRLAQEGARLAFPQMGRIPPADDSAR
jgi:hypothetical protein